MQKWQLTRVSVNMPEQLTLVGTLKGHAGWVTSIATPADPNANFIVSGSRDKTAIVWNLTRSQTNYGVPAKALKGHNHFVQDVTLSSDGAFAITASWDKTLRLWDLKTGNTTKKFFGHTGDVMSVSFSPDNRQIVSGSRDKSIKIWNTLGEIKYNLTDNGHSEWVSCVRVSPNATNPLIVSCGWDKNVKVWGLNQCRLKTSHIGHAGYVNCVAVSPDGSLCASAGKDGTTMLWDLTEDKHLYSLDGNETIHALAFSPACYWLCAATDSCIRIWDLLASKAIIDELRPEFVASAKGNVPVCISLAWSADGRTLYAGYTDNQIRVWQVGSTNF